MAKTSIVIVAVATAAVLATTAAAQPPLDYTVTVSGHIVKGAPNDHFVTTSGALHLPDVTLPAGTYVFKALDSSIIQVRSVDGAQVYTMFFTLPVPRGAEDAEYAVVLASRGPGAPPRVERMFLGRTLAFEPLYDEVGAAGDR
jgi:hypothetical protein